MDLTRVDSPGQYLSKDASNLAQNCGGGLIPAWCD